MKNNNGGLTLRGTQRLRAASSDFARLYDKQANLAQRLIKAMHAGQA